MKIVQTYEREIEKGKILLNQILNKHGRYNCTRVIKAMEKHGYNQEEIFLIWDEYFNN